MKIFEPTGKLHCPYCNKPADDVAEDYVVPGSHAHAQEICGYCDQKFLVRRRADGKIVVANNFDLTEIYKE